MLANIRSGHLHSRNVGINTILSKKLKSVTTTYHDII